jgi:hypothetical protein
MVLTLTIGLWQGYRLDRQATAEITAAKGAAGDAARVNKHLVPKDALAAIVTACGAVRTHFYTPTLPWRDNGDRLMPRVKFTAFIEEHEALVAAFQNEVDTFLVHKYPSAIEQAEFRMGDMFDRDDYPSVSELRRKFYVALDINPVTSVDDFRVQIDDAHVDKVRATMEKAAEQRVQTAMQDVWKRLAEAVGHFHERMANPDAVFRSNLTEKIDELVDMIPGLNVLDDPDIEAIRRQVQSKLGGLDPAGIRKDPVHREALAGEAKQIVDNMAGFMRAFGVKQEEIG